MTLAVENQSQQFDRRSPIIYYGMTWEKFKLVDSAFENPKSFRLSYHEGVFELVPTSREHEILSGIIAFALNFYLTGTDIRFFATGSCTQEIANQVSLQADLSYCFDVLKPVPDLAIEVVISSGGIDKLKKYQVLRTPEVWFWEDGLLKLYRWREDGYQQLENSEWLPELDIKLLQKCLLMGEIAEAMRAFRQGMI